MSPWVDVAKERSERHIGQTLYAHRVNGWLAANFPELCRGGSPHPAAFSAVVRLHGRYGKGCLTRAEHGPMILAAVEWFRQEYEL